MSSLVTHTSASTTLYFVVRAAVALALGALIGLERQWRQRSAGLRTNALVALGAALFEGLGVVLAPLHGTDPTRIAAYVVSGVGFLGAGVLIREGATISGINTAATIWCSAAVGVLAGAGYLVEAVAGAFLVLAAHVGLRPVARRIDRLPPTGDSDVEAVYHFHAVCRANKEAHIRALAVQALQRDFVIRAITSTDIDDKPGLVTVDVELHRIGRDDIALEQAISRLSLEPAISSVSWEVVEPPIPRLGDDE